jgi:hypothetical protein
MSGRADRKKSKRSMNSAGEEFFLPLNFVLCNLALSKEDKNASV